jgi:2-keto-4-pentenoate hydratase/2-oxohepta-3-ene-1,7-dioic acid hydratase in catechol pathway
VLVSRRMLRDRTGPRTSCTVLASARRRRRGVMVCRLLAASALIHELTSAGRVVSGVLIPATRADDPEKFLCIGMNYRDHVGELDNPLPVAPVCSRNFARA